MSNKNERNIHDLENQSKGSVWVLNKTRKEERSELFFTVAKQNGTGLDQVVIPDTWIPIDLTQSVPIKQLIANSDFRRGLRDRFFVVITDEYARELLDQEGASDEQQRLIDLAQGVGGEFLNAPEEQALDDRHDVSDQIRNLGSIIQEGAQEEIRIIGTLRGYDKLSSKEKAYLYEAAENMKKVREYLNSLDD